MPHLLCVADAKFVIVAVELVDCGGFLVGDLGVDFLEF